MIRNLIKTTPQQQNSRSQQKCSVITLNINDTIFSMKRNRLTDWISYQKLSFCFPKETYITINKRHQPSQSRDEKKVLQPNRTKK